MIYKQCQNQSDYKYYFYDINNHIYYNKKKVFLINKQKILL